MKKCLNSLFPKPVLSLMLPENSSKNKNTFFAIECIFSLFFNVIIAGFFSLFCTLVITSSFLTGSSFLFTKFNILKNWNLFAKISLITMLAFAIAIVSLACFCCISFILNLAIFYLINRSIYFFREIYQINCFNISAIKIAFAIEKCSS